MFSEATMHPALEISYAWEGDELFVILIRANNRKFCGEARCYTSREEIGRLSQEISRFPKSRADEVLFSTQAGEGVSYFMLHFICTDACGHVVVRIKIADIVHYVNARASNNVAELELAVDPCSIDTFAIELSKLSSASGKVGIVTATSNGNR